MTTTYDNSRCTLCLEAIPPEMMVKFLTSNEHLCDSCAQVADSRYEQIAMEGGEV